LHKTFGVQHVLRGIDLDIERGRINIVIGGSGQGKSVLMKHLMGLLKPDAGQILVDGQDIVPLRDVALGVLRRKFGMVFQYAALFDSLNVVENIAFPLIERYSLPRDEIMTRVRDLLTRLDLGHVAGIEQKFPAELSGGQRKRVGLAQVLIRDPKILLMDEPFGPLDAQTRQIMGNLLLDLWSADRKAVLFVTHDLEEAIALSDRVVIMSAGPAARIIGDWRVPLQRPRDIAEVKIDPAFHQLHRDIWQTLKAEVMKGYEQTGGG